MKRVSTLDIRRATDALIATIHTYGRATKHLHKADIEVIERQLEHTRIYIQLTTDKINRVVAEAIEYDNAGGK